MKKPKNHMLPLLNPLTVSASYMRKDWQMSGQDFTTKKLRTKRVHVTFSTKPNSAMLSGVVK